jgi:hypothetical protein
MSKYRIIEKVNGLGEKTFHLEEHGFFGWDEVYYSVGMDCSAPKYHKTLKEAIIERDRLLDYETHKKLSNTIISTRVVE